MSQKANSYQLKESGIRDDRIKIINRQSTEIAIILSYNPVHIEKLKEIEGHK